MENPLVRHKKGSKRRNLNSHEGHMGQKKRGDNKRNTMNFTRSRRHDLGRSPLDPVCSDKSSEEKYVGTHQGVDCRVGQVICPVQDKRGADMYGEVALTPL